MVIFIVAPQSVYVCKCELGYFICSNPFSVTSEKYDWMNEEKKKGMINRNFALN